MLSLPILPSFEKVAAAAQVGLILEQKFPLMTRKRRAEHPSSDEDWTSMAIEGRRRGTAYDTLFRGREQEVASSFRHPEKKL